MIHILFKSKIYLQKVQFFEGQNFCVAVGIALNKIVLDIGYRNFNKTRM